MSQDCFRDLEWVKYQLGQHGKGDSSVRKFLRDNGVPVIKGRILERHLFRVWERAAEEFPTQETTKEFVKRALG